MSDTQNATTLFVTLLKSESQYYGQATDANTAASLNAQTTCHSTVIIFLLLKMIDLLQFYRLEG